MDRTLTGLLDGLAANRSASLEAYERLIGGYCPQLAEYAASLAVRERKRVYGTEVFVRGLIEFSNYCKNDCYYCGIRKSNAAAQRYRLSEDDIVDCAHQGYELGFRTIVLQSGEDPYFTDERLCAIIARIKALHPDCAVTLSVGERSADSYRALRQAGADRYLLRHEAADEQLYGQLHPSAMSWAARMQCLQSLRKAGFAVGCGFIVGAPGQTPRHLARDLKLIERLRPQMCGIGPFVPHHATRYAGQPHGSVELTCYLLSLLRLIQPNLLLPATTALGSLDAAGRERGILAGANVVMPNLSPASVRGKYDLYDNKLSEGEEAAEGYTLLRKRIESIGYELVVDRGDPRPDEQERN